MAVSFESRSALRMQDVSNKIWDAEAPHIFNLLFYRLIVIVVVVIIVVVIVVILIVVVLVTEDLVPHCDVTDKYNYIQDNTQDKC